VPAAVPAERPAGRTPFGRTHLEAARRAAEAPAAGTAVAAAGNHLAGRTAEILPYRVADPCRGDPSQGDPCRAGPSRGDPCREVPSQGDPCRAGPSRGDPCREVPSQRDPCRVGPSQEVPFRAEASRNPLDRTAEVPFLAAPSQEGPCRAVPSQEGPSRAVGPYLVVVPSQEVPSPEGQNSGRKEAGAPFPSQEGAPSREAPSQEDPHTAGTGAAAPRTVQAAAETDPRIAPAGRTHREEAARPVREVKSTPRRTCQKGYWERRSEGRSWRVLGW